ncbi:MAG TPA: M48 family metallopeptidase [Candidatus Paceibacterota bacterium]
MIQKSIKIREKNIDYTLKVNKRSKNIRLTVHPDGRCVVTAPRYIPQFIINSFLINKSEWLISKIEYYLNLKTGPCKSKKEKKEEYLKYKENATLLVKERIEYFNTFYNYKWNRIVIRNQKTRWGSCSKRGNLNFNYKIVFLSKRAADYIVVHELCHLREFNHSHNFWSLVSQTIPDYLEIRKELKNKGLELS